MKPLQLESTYTTDDMSGKDVVLGHDNLFGLPIAKKAEKTDNDEWDAVPATGIVSDAKDMGSVLSMFLAAGGKTLSYDQIEKYMLMVLIAAIQFLPLKEHQVLAG